MGTSTNIVLQAWQKQYNLILAVEEALLIVNKQYQGNY